METKKQEGLIEELKKRMENLENRVVQLEKLVKMEGGAHLSKKQLSVKELLLRKKPKTYTDKVLAVAYYLEKYRGQKCFSSKEVNDLLKKAKEKLKNTSDAIYRNVKKGLLMECENKKGGLKTYQLTQMGVDYVETKLNS